MRIQSQWGKKMCIRDRYEVEDYMHLEGAGLAGETAGAEDEDTVMTAKAKAARSRSIAPSLADDKELEAIFVRTYGEIKRRKPQKERTFLSLIHI